MSDNIVSGAKFDKYNIYPVEKLKKSGQNKKIWSKHVIEIENVKYTFLAEGTEQWAYKKDTISFEWEWDKSNSYRNIKHWTFKAYDDTGTEIVRGNHERCKPWRHR